MVIGILVPAEYVFSTYGMVGLCFEQDWHYKAAVAFVALMVAAYFSDENWLYLSVNLV